MVGPGRANHLGAREFQESRRLDRDPDMSGRLANGLRNVTSASDREPVRLRDGIYECAHCGTVLDVAAGEVPQFVIVALSGEPNIRVLFLHHREIHRGIVDDGREPAAPAGDESGS